jgi:selenocysteine lyase/cysteine desulfurase
VPTLEAVRLPVPAPTAEAETEPLGTQPADHLCQPLLPVVGGDLTVPVVRPDGSLCAARYANLDYAASAPALASVAARVAEVLPYYSSVHRGAGYASQVSTRLYESARATVAGFVGAGPDDVVVFTRNTTDALNLLAAAVPAGGEVVHLDIEHHANLLPWQATGAARCVPAADTLASTLAALDADLAARPAALLAVTGSSNVTGEVLPVDRLAEIAHRHGARLLVDAAQLAPHQRIDLASLGADYLAFSGHKLYAPFGAGVLVGRRDWLDAAPAHLAGGGAVQEVGLDVTRWAPAPQRHEGGTPNVLGAVAIAAACEALAALPERALADHETALTKRLRAGLAGIRGVRLLRIWPDSTRRIGVVGFTVDGHDAGRVAAYLSAEHGIGVRDGRFCAHPLLARLAPAGGHEDGAASADGTALRASLGVGSGAEDVDRLVGALTRLVAEGEGLDYAVVDGRWAPSPDPRPEADVLAGNGSWAGSVPGTAGASPCSPVGSAAGSAVGTAAGSAV